MESYNKQFISRLRDILEDQNKLSCYFRVEKSLSDFKSSTNNWEKINFKDEIGPYDVNVEKLNFIFKDKTLKKLCDKYIESREFNKDFKILIIDLVECFDYLKREFAGLYDEKTDFTKFKLNYEVNAFEVYAVYVFLKLLNKEELKDDKLTGVAVNMLSETFNLINNIKIKKCK